MLKNVRVHFPIYWIMGLLFHTVMVPALLLMLAMMFQETE